MFVAREETGFPWGVWLFKRGCVKQSPVVYRGSRVRELGWVGVGSRVRGLGWGSACCVVVSGILEDSADSVGENFRYAHHACAPCLLIS